MYKVIDLGFEVPETGEPRIQLMQDSLIKTASSEIQTFWDSLERSDDYCYIWVIGVSAMEYYGCNNNGDAFTEADLKKKHSDFVQKANVFLQHVNKDPAKGIGKPVFSWYNDTMHRVELVLRIDKNNLSAAETVRKIVAGEPVFVSMGCTVKYDVCSICGNKAPTRKQYCDHLRYNMKKILQDGRQVYAINPDPMFFDISIVAKPADPTAHTLDKIAADGVAVGSAVSSAELGEFSEEFQRKLAALKKISDIVKRIDSDIVDVRGHDGSQKDADGDDEIPEVSAAMAVGRHGFQDFPYPEMPYESLSAMGVSPAGFLAGMRFLGAPVTLGDAAWMSGSKVLGRCPTRDEFSGMFSMLPAILSSLLDKPNMLGGLVRGVCGHYLGECEEPLHRSLIIRVLKPVAEARITLVRGMAPEGALEKFAEAIGTAPIEPEIHYGRTLRERLEKSFSPRTENFAQITLRDRHGREAVTTPYHMRQADGKFNPEKYLRPGVAAALGMGAISAAISEPTLLGKAMAASLLGIPALAMMAAGTPGEQVGGMTSEGVEVPMSTMIGSYKFQKSAASTPRFGTMAGMALPGALALDYMYNKWKYGPYSPESDMGTAGKSLHRAGSAVVSHPMTALVGGAVLGSQVGRAASSLSKILARTRKV